MKLTKLITISLLSGVAFGTLYSCKKVDSPKPLEGAGQTIVKFVFENTTVNPNGEADTSSGKYSGYVRISAKLDPNPQVIEVADLRRDAPNSDELNKPMTVIITNDNGAVTAYDPELTPLPFDAYIPDASNPLSGNNYTVSLNPGEFAKVLKVTIPDITSLDLNKRYALGFTISSVDADGHISALQKSLVVEIGTNNKWDGIYRLFGGFARADQPGFLGVTMSPAGYYQPYYLVTSGAASVEPRINTADYGLANTQIIYNAGAGNYTFFTGVAPRLNISESGGAVTVTPGEAAIPPSVDFTQNATELAASKYYPNGIPGHPFADGRPSIVAHFRWTSGGIDRITKDTFVYLQPR